MIIIIIIADYSDRAVYGGGLGCLNTGIVVSNPAQEIVVCSRLSVLWFNV
jgi:hypothetical protein